MGASGDGGLVQVPPGEIESAGGLIGLAADPLTVGSSAVAGGHVALPGFAMSDAANAFSSGWAAALSGLAGQVNSAASQMRATSAVYIDQEASISGFYGG